MLFCATLCCAVLTHSALRSVPKQVSVCVCQATEDPDTALGPEEEGQAAEPQELYCLCRQPDDPTRDYIECTDCAQWYHPECVGASIEVSCDLSSKLPAYSKMKSVQIRCGLLVTQVHASSPSSGRQGNEQLCRWACLDGRPCLIHGIPT